MTWRILGPLAGAAAIAAVIVAVLAPSTGKVLDAVARAADTTAAAGTVEFGLAGSVTSAGETIPISGSGAPRMCNARMRMSMSCPVPGAGQMQLEEIFHGSAFYMHFPAAVA